MQWLLGVTIELTSWEMEMGLTINPSAGRANSEQRRELQQKRVLVSLNDSYQPAESRWDVVGIAEFGSFLGEPLDPQVPADLVRSSQIPNLKSEIEANAQMLE